MNIQSHLARAGLFDARVPRYTSYPTAPNFGPSVTPGQFADWVRQITPGSRISLYLHVPFCRRLCWFCACRTQGTTSDAPVISYLRSLRAEIALLKATLPEGVTLSRLHWGGGTPTLLAAPMIEELSAAIFDAVPMGEGAEFSVEIDPGEIDVARLAALAAMGMNRASIGVQDFDPLIQATIGRIQSYELTAEVAAAIRKAGIRSLNADILFGLPHQTRARISRSVEQLIALAPNRVALYGYAHVPWMSRRQQMITPEAMPSPEERLALFETARDLFLAAGYRQIGIDHFAVPEDGLARAEVTGHLRRNFQGYTDDTAEVLIGLGASSISRFPQGYAQNLSGTSDYTKAVQAGRFATHRGHAFAGEDTLRARIIEALMCDFRVSRAEILAHFPVTPGRLQELLADAAQAFADQVDLDDLGLTIHPDAQPLARMIAHRFDAYTDSKALHSAAV